MEQNKTVLSVRDLNIDFKVGSKSIRVVTDVSMEAKRGKVLGIIGESGSGKTMTCMSIMGLLPRGIQITNGSILLNDRDITRLPIDEMRKIRGNQVSMIMQNPIASFNPVRTIGVHFVETLQTHIKLNKKEARDLAIHYMNQVNLPRPAELVRQYPFQLSGGMLQRVMIAIAMATNPDVLIADEPTTALDTGNQKRVLYELDNVRNITGAAIIMITHDLGVIAELADEVIVMYCGDIVETASVRELFDNPKHPYTQKLLQSRIRFFGADSLRAKGR